MQKNLHETQASAPHPMVSGQPRELITAGERSFGHCSQALCLGLRVAEHGCLPRRHSCRRTLVGGVEDPECSEIVGMALHSHFRNYEIEQGMTVVLATKV